MKQASDNCKKILILWPYMMIELLGSSRVFGDD